MEEKRGGGEGEIYLSGSFMNWVPVLITITGRFFVKNGKKGGKGGSRVAGLCFGTIHYG